MSGVGKPDEIALVGCAASDVVFWMRFAEEFEHGKFSGGTGALEVLFVAFEDGSEVIVTRHGGSVLLIFTHGC